MHAHSLPAELHNFVGVARETAAMPPAVRKGKQILRNPCDSKGATHTPPKELKGTTIVRVRAQTRQTNDDTKGGQDRPGVSGCDETEPSDQEQTNEPDLIITTWATSKLGLVYGRTNVCAKGERMRCQGMKTEGYETKAKKKVCKGTRMKAETKWRVRKPTTPNPIKEPRKTCLI